MHPYSPQSLHRTCYRSLQAGLSLVEVLIASSVMVVVFTGIIGALIQGRRMSEGSVRQGSAVAIIQGYIEQIKNMEYDEVYVSPSVGSSDSFTIATIRDQLTTDPLTVSQGEAPSTIPEIGTTPAGAINNEDDIDINNTPTDPNDDLHLNVWVWVKDLTVTGSDVQRAKSITLIYTYDVKDGGKVRSFRDSVRTIRSEVPTF